MSNVNTMDSTYGALFLGLILSAVFYGVTLLQTFFYYRQYPNDSRFMKSIVLLLWVLDTAQLILCTIGMYHYLITNFNNPIALGRTTWGINLQIDCNGLIGIIVQCFFAWRVRTMSGNIILTIVILIFATIHFSLGVYFTVVSFVSQETEKFSQLFWVAGTGLGCAAAADILIAGALCYYLSKSRTGSSRADSLITTLIAYSLTTGLLTSFIACLCVVLYASMPTNLIGYGFFLLIGKCYVNSLLAALNCRDSLREKLNQQPNTLLHLTPLGALSTIDHGAPAEPSSSGGTGTKTYPYLDTLEEDQEH